MTDNRPEPNFSDAGRPPPRGFRLQQAGTIVEPKRAVSGWLSVISGGLSIFVFAPFFAPFGYMFALFALIRGQVLLALAGIALSTFGLLTSPIFLAMAGLAGFVWWVWPSWL